MANSYSDLPTPKRAEQIVAEARQRLAASGGKASMLPAMIERVKNEYAQKDAQAAQQEGYAAASNYQQPNTIDNYIDRVLQMSGMTQAPQKAAAAPVDNSEYAAPVGEVERGGPLPDAAPNPANEAQPTAENNDGGGGIINYILTALLGAGGGYAAAKLMNKPETGAALATQDAADEAAPTVRPEAADAADAVDADVVDADEGEGMRAIDSEINRTMGGNNQLPPRNPDDEAAKGMTTSSPYDQSIRSVAEARTADEAIANIKSGGIQFSPEQERAFRQAFPSLKQRAAEITGKAARGAFRP